MFELIYTVFRIVCLGSGLRTEALKLSAVCMYGLGLACNRIVARITMLENPSPCIIRIV